MTIHTFLTSWSLPIITSAQFGLINPKICPDQRKVQLQRWLRSGHLVRLKRGIYQITSRSIDDFTLASYLYPQSYLTAETVLSHYSLIPDVAINFTSATPTTTNQFSTARGLYLYSKLPASLYFGFHPATDSHYPKLHYQIADPEKAFLDWIYLRHLQTLDPSRLDLSQFNPSLLSTYLKRFPAWVNQVVSLCKS